MKRTLLIVPDKTFFSKKNNANTILVFFTCFILSIGFIQETKAQCEGPYQYFEGIPVQSATNAKTAMIATGWIFGGDTEFSVGTTGTTAHSGIRYLQVYGEEFDDFIANPPTLTTPLIISPAVFSFILSKKMMLLIIRFSFLMMVVLTGTRYLMEQTMLQQLIIQYLFQQLYLY